MKKTILASSLLIIFITAVAIQKYGCNAPLSGYLPLFIEKKPSNRVSIRKTAIVDQQPQKRQYKDIQHQTLIRAGKTL